MLQDPLRRNWLWYFCQMVMRLVFTVLLRYRARGVENVPASGGALLVINHQSSLDPFLAGLPLNRPVSYLARDSLFRLPFIGWVLRNTYVMPISREAASPGTIRETVSRLERGFLCGIFPEGTRSYDGEVRKFKPGFIALVRRAEVPLIPIGVAGANEAYPRNAWLLRPRRVCVVFGTPITVDEVKELSARGREEEFAELVRQRVIACQREAEQWRRS